MYFFLFLLDKYVGVKLLGHRVGIEYYYLDFSITYDRFYIYYEKDKEVIDYYNVGRKSYI